jgi:hypothetical protein
MRILTVPDFAGDGAAHSLAQIMTLKGVAVPTPPLARGVLIHEASAGSTNSRMGDATVSATQGLLLGLNDTLILPQLGSMLYSDSPMWNLNDVYMFAATGDTLSIALML